MKQTVFFTILIVIFLYSCSNYDLSDYSLEDVPIVIDVDSLKKTDSLKFSYIRYINLETTPECLIGFATKTLIKNDKIYIADFSQAKALFVFDLNGKFLFKIFRLGQGPEEYIDFCDFDVQTDEEIYMYDPYGKKFLIFNSEGEYLRNIQTDYYFSNFCLINNIMYWSKLREAGNMFSNLAIYDIKSKKTEFILKDKKFLYDLRIIDFNPYNFYYSPDSIVYYSPKFSEIIYSIDKKGVHPAIGIKNLKKTPKNIVDEWLQEENGMERTKKILNNKYFIENKYIYENDKYITMEFLSGIFSHIIIYDKQSKSAFNIPFSYYFKSIGIDKIGGSTGKDFFSVISFNPENVYHKKILESRKELKNWKEDDNPVIAIFNLDM